MWLAREQRLLFCRALDGIVDIGDGEPLISLPRLAHMPNAGKGNVRPSHKVSLFRGFCKKTLPLPDGSLRVKVILNGRIRQGELRFRYMNGISPEQQLFSIAFKQITCVARSVPRCGHGVYSGQHHLARFKMGHLARAEVWGQGFLPFHKHGPEILRRLVHLGSAEPELGLNAVHMHGG